MAAGSPPIGQVAAKYGLDPKIFANLVRRESGGNQGARSPVGAIGLTQLMPATARSLGVNPYDPRQNLEGGAKYLRQQLDRFGGDYTKALAAYNAGPGAVQKYGGVPPFAETQAYVKAILGGKAPVAGRAPAPAPSAASGPSRGQIIARFLLSNEDPLSFATALRGAKAPSSPVSSAPATVKGTAGGNTVASFEGVPVAAWMVPALKFARQHGWTGKLTSGVRTYAQQAALYANRGSNPNPVAPPGKSNHEIENGGAFDATQPQQLNRILQAFTGKRPIWAPTVGLKDPVHFSATGK